MSKRRLKASPKRAVARATRERILAAAAVVFGKLGHASTRVEDILHAADVSRPTFYKAFESKDDVFEELSERHHRDIRDRIIRSIVGIADPAAQLEATTDAFMRWRAELGPIGRVLDVEARIPGSSIAHHRSKTLEEMAALIAERTRAVGRREVDPVLYYGLIAAMERVADLLLSRHPVSEAALERAKRGAVRIFSGALAGSGDRIPPLPAAPERPEKLKLT